MTNSTDLTSASYDGVVSALTGNGEVCTTLGPDGYHVRHDARRDTSHMTQHFVMAGRRLPGPRHELADLGSLSLAVSVGGRPCSPDDWSQRIDPELGLVLSSASTGGPTLTTTSFVALTTNAFLAETIVRATGGPCPALAVEVGYRCPHAPLCVRCTGHPDGAAFAWSSPDETGSVTISSTCMSRSHDTWVTPDEHGVRILFEGDLAGSAHWILRTLLQFSDRMTFEWPLTLNDFERLRDDHTDSWGRFMAMSAVHTGDGLVDRFRQMGLYTLRCQTTPWSVPASLSRPYWGGGAFHDEIYPFYGLISSNHAELAARIPYFRLATLPEAVRRARGRGALYPWSSTEFGQERDPDGLWLTERFHLGQFATVVWAHWLYERDLAALSDQYPVLKAIARYFETQMVERDALTQLQMAPCVDFDESVGAVRGGPFTVSAAVAALTCSADAADTLGVDPGAAWRWRRLAAEIRALLPTRRSRTHGNTREETFAIPDGKPLHYSIVGPVFPFQIETHTPRAIQSAKVIHRACRSSRGWKSGFSEAFDGSNWMWTAGHLGIVHAIQGSGQMAWDCVSGGPLSAGPFLSPNEHLSATGVVQVPWFTTGVGAWIYALNALFVQVDRSGAHLLAAVPPEAEVEFEGVRANCGVTVSGQTRGPHAVRLAARSPQPLEWVYSVPRSNLGALRPVGRVVSESPTMLTVRQLVGPNETELLRP